MADQKRLFRLGLTGGIAAGKSTVAARWRETGVAVIDADDLAHRTLQPGTPTHQEIVKTFGAGILDADGTINRPRLGEIVFADEQKRLALNQIVHPAVRRMWQETLGRLENDGQTRLVVLCIPLLYEVGAETEMDCVVVAGCSEQTQRARLAAKGLNAAQAGARMRAQGPIQKKMDKADFVIWNDGSLRVLAEQADIIWATIKENHYAPSKN
jgi:dephospho-CoA kinase